jgi:hypothetical protein
MSLRKSPPSERGPDGTCPQLAFVSRLASDDPAALGRAPWSGHLDICPECREEASGHARALALYRALEGERVAPSTSNLTWEAFLAAAHPVPEASMGRRPAPRWALPLAAVALGAVAISGLLGWNGMQEEGRPAPAQIVSVQPQEQHLMEQVLRWALESATPGGDPLHLAAVENLTADLEERGLPPYMLPEGHELTATLGRPWFDPESTEPASAPIIRAPSLTAGGERRIAPSPVLNRLIRTSPALRLERRLTLAQPVGFSPRY